MLLTRSKDPYLEVLPVWLKVQLQRLLAAQHKLHHEEQAFAQACILMHI